MDGVLARMPSSHLPATSSSRPLALYVCQYVLTFLKPRFFMIFIVRLSLEFQWVVSPRGGMRVCALGQHVPGTHGDVWMVWKGWQSIAEWISLDGVDCALRQAPHSWNYRVRVLLHTYVLCVFIYTHPLVHLDNCELLKVQASCARKGTRRCTHKDVA